MEIQKRTGEKLEDYFSRLVAEGVECDSSYQNVTLEDIESVLRSLNQFSNDKRDVIWCLLNSDFPSPFANATGFSIADLCHICCCFRRSEELPFFLSYTFRHILKETDCFVKNIFKHSL